MQIEFDPDMIRVSIELWRKATDMEIPLAPSIRSHFLSRRGAILEGFIKVASNWLTLLDSCSATGDDLDQLDALRNEIEEFKAWDKAGILELKRLAEE